MKYVPAHRREIRSKHPIGLEINVSVGRALTDEDSIALYEAADIIVDALQRGSINADPEEHAAAKSERLGLLSLFDSPIYVEDIPYGYCNLACCSLRRWLRVTTRVGPIEVGWRKRVINISWAGSSITKTAEELFPDARGTKGKDFIHAYGPEEAKAFVGVLTSLVEVA